MAKVFRLGTTGNNTLTDWSSNNTAFPYNKARRDSIKDPNGEKSSIEITSIPSPFARIDLVKNAFREVCSPSPSDNQVHLDGTSIYHKIVSDTLDVGQIFFNIDNFSNQVEIIRWDKKTEISALTNSVSPGHQCYASTLETYLAADSATYNFGANFDAIYLLNYKGGNNMLDIIGATSPATLFFSSANDLSYVDLVNGQDKPFDNELLPLYGRDPQYIKFWFYFRSIIPNFALLFPEIDTYLTMTYSAIADPSLKNSLLNPAGLVNLFGPIPIRQGDVEVNISVLGFPLLKLVDHQFQSDFEIDPNSEVILDRDIQKLPLVLPITSGKYQGLYYVKDTWGIKNMAPYCDSNDWETRSLPHDGTKYPFLTVSDFLEDTIIEIPHALNKKDYFDGNFNSSNSKLSYLLPLKNLFFEFFTIDDVIYGRNGVKMIEMKELAGNGISVTLRIPIKGNTQISYVEYSRLYFRDIKPDIMQNKGSILTGEDFTAFIMPNIRFSNLEEAYYNVGCISTYSKNYNLEFYKGQTHLANADIRSNCRNENGQEKYKCRTYTIAKEIFDYISVNVQNATGVIIPILKKQISTDSYDFAIDLGTSYTHIEYRKHNDRVINAFSYDESDNLISHVFKPSFFKDNGRLKQDDLLVENTLLKKDFLPDSIGGDSKGINRNKQSYYFPNRTVLSCANNINWEKVIYPFEFVNIPLTYDKEPSLLYNKFNFNIKWGKDKDINVISSYIDCLMLMIRNKVLLNNGKLSDTQLTWFYPTSMSPKRRSLLRNVWNDAYTKYFGAIGAMNEMTESSAPVQYYFNKIAETTDIVSIDIGGGTTDIAFASNKRVNYVTSVRFASNALFENSYSPLDITNGIIDCYKDEFGELIAGIIDLKEVFNEESNQNPVNMASFLFSLRNNVNASDINPQEIDLDSKLERDEDFKIAFILFYTSIIYHVAQVIKVKGFEMPRHLVFSGNGSNVIKIISSDVNILTKYTRLIFEEVLGREYDKPLQLIGLDQGSNPKEATCKGGLLISNIDNVGNEENIILRATGDDVVDKELEYKDVDQEYLGKTVDSVKSFFDFILNHINKKFNLDDNFGVSKASLQIAREKCNSQDIITYLKKGYEERRNEIGSDEKIDETFFFYPIKGVLNAITQSIYHSLK